MVVHLLSVVFPLSIAWIAKLGTSLFSLHPFLMTVAYSLFMTQALMTFSPHSSLVLQSGRDRTVRWHWLLNLMALLCAAVGVFSIYMNKEFNGWPHFTSWHGLVGLTANSYFVFQFCAGIMHLFPKFARKFMPPKLMKQVHAVSGMCLFALGTTALVLGLRSNWFIQQVGDVVSVCFCMVPISFVVVVVMQVVNSRFLGKRK